MRCYQRRYCLCCKHCSKCQEFTKVISGNSIDIYIYVNRSKDKTNGNSLIESNGFVFNNIHGIPINTHDLLHMIESNEFNCQRCKSILIRASNILKKLIHENKVVVICASCVSKCKSGEVQLCQFCHKIYNKFISKKKSHGATTNACAHKWSSEIEHLLSNEGEEKKILPFIGESHNIRIAVSHSSLGLIEKHVDVKYTSRPLNLNSKSDVQVITKDLSNVSQTHVEEEYNFNPIKKILKNHNSLEGFVYVFPKKDIERYDLIRRISSSLLIKEIQEKLVKYKRNDILKEIKAEGEEIKTFRIKKTKIWNSKRANIDEEKFLSMNKSKTPKNPYKQEEGKEVDIHERMKNVTDTYIQNKSETIPKIKIKENIYSKSTGIVHGTNTFETFKNGEESGDGFLNLSKRNLKKKNKEEKQKILSNRKRKTLESISKSLISDPVQSLTKIDQNRSNLIKRGKLKKVKSNLEKNKRKTLEYKKNDKYVTTEDFKLSRVKIRDASVDNFHIEMVKIKQSLFAREKHKEPKHLSDLKITPLIIQQHKNHQNRKMPSCLICSDSELEIKVDELLQEDKSLEVSEIIMGQKIVKNRKLQFNTVNKNSFRPILFESTFKQFDADEEAQKDSCQGENEISTVLEKQSQSLQKFSEQDAAKGGIHYKLSNRSFIERGWTMLPTEKIVRKLNVYRMRPSHPEFDWFEHNKSKRLMHYDTGETLAEIDEGGRGRWFYKNGRLALDYYNAEEVNAGQRIVVYSNGEPDDKGRARPITVLATFDYLGNGIVFDHTGRVRLKYNQTEGVVMDKDIGPVSHWKWHELNDPPILLKVMIDTQMAVKDPEILKLGGTGENIPCTDNEEMLAIEFDNFIKEKNKKLSQKFKPFQIKMKALKINENFSLRVLDQATIYLTFREGQTNLKLNLGMILDHKEIVDTDTAELGEVTCNLERLPARTDSLAILQRSVAHAQQIEKLRIEHERRFKFPEFRPSVDRLTAAISRPLKLLVLTEPEVKCMCSKTKRISH